MTLNIEKVYKKFQDIKLSLERLRAFSSSSVEDFLTDQDQQDIASFRLIVATEAAIDLCLYVATNKLNQVPEEYASCFKLLGEAGLIDPLLSDRLVEMARFRNLLVHQYYKIDYSRLYQIITSPDIDDLEEFVRQIGLLIENK